MPIFRFFFISVLISTLLACKNEKVSESLASKKATNTFNKPLNILWITAEDLSPRFSFYGDSTANTPNLNWLAKEGVVYDNCFSVSGVCAPSRHALITGMYPISTGANMMRSISNSSALKDVDEKNLPHPIYEVVTPPEVRCFTEYLREIGYYCTNNSKTDYQFHNPITAWDENGNDAQFYHAPDSQPFFSVYNFMVTHESGIWNRDTVSRKISKEKIKLTPFYPDLPEVRQEITTLYNNIEELDRQVGVLLDTLRKRGKLDNTIIFFFGYHGDGIPRYKTELYTTGLNVPLVIRYPKGKKDKDREQRLVSFVDFAPSLLSLAEIEPPSHLQGQPFLG